MTLRRLRTGCSPHLWTMAMRQKVRTNRMDKGNANAAGAVVATPQLAAAAPLSPAGRLVVTNKIQLRLLCSALQVNSLLPTNFSCGYCEAWTYLRST